ncbi:hypothetical protein AAG570_012654 [Ranatra chinensis]|uniref:Uncharacterized protein n=1 Tax=Ranatra chinensis TaxID=642074 RepID=A0ABD0YEI1_9HEMI
MSAERRVLRPRSCRHVSECKPSQSVYYYKYFLSRLEHHVCLYHARQFLRRWRQHMRRLLRTSLVFGFGACLALDNHPGHSPGHRRPVRRRPPYRHRSHLCSFISFVEHCNPLPCSRFQDHLQPPVIQEGEGPTTLVEPTPLVSPELGSLPAFLAPPPPTTPISSLSIARLILSVFHLGQYGAYGYPASVCG